MNAVDRRLARVHSHEDARRLARRRLPRGLYDYVDGGAEDETTLQWNRDGFAELAFRPRTGTWVAEPDLSTKLLGADLSFPVLTAPCGGMRLVHPEGDLAVARGAAAAGTVHVATSASGYSLEEIAQVEGPQWFQAYRFSDEGAMRQLVGRADVAGYDALVATVDTAVAGNREKDYRNGFSYKMRVNASNAVKMAPQMATRPGWVYRFVRDGMPFDLPNTADLTVDGKPMELTEMTRAGKDSHSPSWADIAWMREHWSRPLVVKGILTVDDARRARDLGADAIVVSNHGGRQLDGAPASIRVLPDVVDAVGGDVEVLLDSGVRRGSDVLKARALGATAVLVGRLPTWGLAVAGEPGVAHVLEVLRTEMVRTMRLLGCASLSDLDPTWLVPGDIPGARTSRHAEAGAHA